MSSRIKLPSASPSFTISSGNRDSVIIRFALNNLFTSRQWFTFERRLFQFVSDPKGISITVAMTFAHFIKIWSNAVQFFFIVDLITVIQFYFQVNFEDNLVTILIQSCNNLFISLYGQSHPSAFTLALYSVSLRATLQQNTLTVSISTYKD